MQLPEQEERRHLQGVLLEAGRRSQRKRLALEKQMSSGCAGTISDLLAEVALADQIVRELRMDLSSSKSDDVLGMVRTRMEDELGLTRLIETYAEKQEREFGRPNGFDGLVFASPRGTPILVCCKRTEGDDAMRRVSHGSDLWFQVRSGNGARVLLRTSMSRGMKGSRECLATAAALAAYYSDARHLPEVEVGYTDSRHVARANAARGGKMRDRKRINAIRVRPRDALPMVRDHTDGLVHALLAYGSSTAGFPGDYEPRANPSSTGKWQEQDEDAMAPKTAAHHESIGTPGDMPTPRIPARLLAVKGLPGLPNPQSAPLAAATVDRPHEPSPTQAPKVSKDRRVVNAGSEGRVAPVPKKRATRRQRLEAQELEVVRERLTEAGIDRREGWRASKAKSHRRSRRYENRLLRDVFQGADYEDD